MQWLNDTIKVRQQITTIKTMLIVPLCTGITLVIVMQYLINPIFGALNQAMVAFLLPPENPGAAFTR